MPEGCSVIKTITSIKRQTFPEDMFIDRLREILVSGDPGIDQIMDYLLESRGKLLRPRLVYLCASFNHVPASEVSDTAAAVELIHMASLIHDDVIDQALIRRGRDSINAHWGEKISVLTGDYLFASAFHLISRLENPRIMEKLSHTIKLMCSGEIKQMSQSQNLLITQEEYFDRCFAKTACLFASSCRVGALAGGMADHQADWLEQFGLCLGYAYQIIDDVLDFVAESHELGKPVGGDLLEGNLTLPVLIALEDPDHSSRMRNLLRNGQVKSEDLPRIIQVLLDSRSLAISIRWAGAFLHQGLDLLENLPESSARHELKELAIFLLEGYYKGLDHRQVQDMEA